MHNLADFDLDLTEGELHEQLVKRVLTGQTRVEVKTDRLATTTGNIFIEYEYKGRPSGLEVSKAEYYSIVIPQTKSIFMILTTRLKDLVKGCRVVYGGDNNMSKGYLLPVKRLTQ